MADGPQVTNISCRSQVVSAVVSRGSRGLKVPWPESWRSTWAGFLVEDHRRALVSAGDGTSKRLEAFSGRGPHLEQPASASRSLPGTDVCSHPRWNTGMYLGPKSRHGSPATDSLCFRSDYESHSVKSNTPQLSYISQDIAISTIRDYPSQ